VRKLTGVISVLVVCVLVAGSTSPATAAWSISGLGSAGAGADAMPAGLAPTASTAGSTVTVGWPAATFADGTAVAGYVVNRYNASTGASATVGGSCGGVITNTSCSEAVAPGSWIYTDTPVQLNWTGTASPLSNTITIPLT
jgi:hypothetical protein